ncbi:MAG: hypothetical protein CMM50_05315 [Rhodospirillaceae bacterium]|nr:hypothetical protein [Rhodospirillaceae bacterium]|tara:strand:+ start:522 stop:836 length:315 start_codon:yes stop_codon:yes gene_type:complete
MTRVYDLAHGRAGDKGHAVNISVIAYDEAGFERLKRALTPEAVMERFKVVADGPVRRYELPKLRALNFIVDHIKGGGVTASLGQDLHGKSLSFLLLGMELPENF